MPDKVDGLGRPEGHPDFGQPAEDPSTIVPGRAYDLGGRAPAHPDYGKPLAPKPKRRVRTSAPKETPKNLVVVHNLSEAGLGHAERLGGLAAPSLAVVHKDHPFANFGDVTLVAGHDLADPKKTPIFDADVYSPRQPRAKFRTNEKAVRKFQNDLRPYLDEVTGQKFAHNAAEDKVEEAGHQAVKSDYSLNAALKLKWLREVKGHHPERPTREAPLEVEFSKQPALREFFARRGVDNGARPGDDYYRELGEATKKAIEQHVAGTPEEDQDDEGEMPPAQAAKYRAHRLKSHIDRHFDDGDLNFGTADRLFRDVEKVGRTETDPHAFRDKIEEAVQRHGPEEFERWADAQAKPLEGEPYLPKYTESGGHRKLPYDMTNVLREMTRTIKGGEGFNYGPGSARAVGAKKFASVDQMRQHAHRLVTDEEMSKVKDEVNNKFSDIASKFAKYHPAGDRFGFMDTLVEALGESFKRGRSLRHELKASGFQDVPDHLVSELSQFGRDLVSSPTQYFEAKPQRAVGLHEFRAAAVPHDASPETLATLARHGVTDVERYQRNDPESRRRAVEAVARRNHLLLSEHAVGLEELAKAEPLDKAIRDIPQGKLVDGYSWRHDYSHVLSPQHRAAGHRLEVHEQEQPGGSTRLWAKVTTPRTKAHEFKGVGEEIDKRPVVGVVSGVFWPHNKTFQVGASRVDDDFTGKGLGRAAYEALLAHAHHAHGAETVIGDVHSTSAHGVHESIARRHGTGYVGVKRPEITHQGDWDNAYDAYEYPLHKSDEQARCSLVLVTNGRGHFLFGKRRDSGLWTVPAGHADPGESPEDCARRELLEETGLAPTSLVHLRTQQNPDCVLDAFTATVDGAPTNANDPDREIDDKGWEWVDCRTGVPANIYDHLNGPEGDANIVRAVLDLKKDEHRVWLDAGFAALAKGSWQRRHPFDPQDPDQVSREEKRAVAAWQGPPDTRGHRREVPQMDYNGRERAIRKLASLTPTRVVSRPSTHPADDGAMVHDTQILMHRGMSDEEVGRSVRDGRVQHDEVSSWTPSYGTAAHWRRQYNKDWVSSSAAGRPVSAWISTSKIRSVPRQLGEVDPSAPGASGKLVGPNAYSGAEHEVIVDPHSSDLEPEGEKLGRPTGLGPSAALRAENSLDNRINYRGKFPGSGMAVTEKETKDAFGKAEPDTGAVTSGRSTDGDGADIAKAVLDPAAGYVLHVSSDVATKKYPPSSRPYTQVVATHPEHGTVGSVVFWHGADGEMTAGDTVGMVNVDPAHRRKGLASAMYAAAERHSGRKIVPSSHQTEAGQALWAGNAKVKQFGKSEDIAKAMYHWAPASARRDIARHGLDHRRSPDFDPRSGGVNGNFLHHTESVARDWVPDIDRTHDLYEVDTTGLDLKPDPYDTGDASYVEHPIPPSRLRLVSGAGRIAKAELDPDLTEVESLLRHPDPAERRLALKLSTVTTRDLGQALLDPDDSVYRAAFNHPDAPLHTLAGSARDLAGEPVHHRHDDVLHDPRCTPDLVTAMHRAVQDDVDLPLRLRAARLAVVAAHPMYAYTERMEKAESVLPRVFYRGTIPGNTNRISTGDDWWDSQLFASSNLNHAKSYGSSIERIEAHPDAKILYEGTHEFRKIARPRQGESLLQFSSRAAQAAKKSGYHAVHFARQGDVGTVILDESKFHRHLPAGDELTKHVGHDVIASASAKPDHAGEHRYPTNHEVETPMPHAAQHRARFMASSQNDPTFHMTSRTDASGAAPFAGRTGHSAKVVHDGFVVKPYHSAGIEGGAGGWAEATSQALHHAAGLGAHHQVSFVAPYGEHPASVSVLEQAKPLTGVAQSSLTPEFKDAAWRIAAMDFLTSNDDRNTENLMVRPDGTPLAIDHAGAFRYRNDASAWGRPSFKNNHLMDRFLSSVEYRPSPNPGNWRTMRPSVPDPEYLESRGAEIGRWWAGVRPDVRHAMTQRLRLVNDPALRDRIKAGFEGRAGVLDRLVDGHPGADWVDWTPAEPVAKALPETKGYWTPFGGLDHEGMQNYTEILPVEYRDVRDVPLSNVHVMDSSVNPVDPRRVSAMARGDYGELPPAKAWTDGSQCSGAWNKLTEGPVDPAHPVAYIHDGTHRAHAAVEAGAPTLRVSFDSERPQGRWHRDTPGLAKALGGANHLAALPNSRIPGVDDLASKLTSAHPAVHQPRVDRFEANLNAEGAVHDPEPHKFGGISPKRVYRHAGDRYMVKPFHESGFPHPAGWGEMTSQALYHAAGIGHLHQPVHVTGVGGHPDAGGYPALVVHMGSGLKTLGEDSEHGGDRLSKLRADPAKAEALRRIALMDTVTGLSDRHKENLMLDPEGNSLAIDHGMAFGDDHMYAQGKYAEPRRAWYGRLQSYSGDHSPETWAWWDRVEPAVRQKFAEHADMFPDPEYRARLIHAFDARLAHVRQVREAARAGQQQVAA